MGGIVRGIKQGINQNGTQKKHTTNRRRKNRTGY